MGFMYSASQDNVAYSTAADLWLIQAGADRPITLHWLEILQTSDLGDAQEEVLRIGIYRGVTGTVTDTATTVALDNNAATKQATIDNNDSSTGGSLVHIIGWNIRQAGPVWVPTPECRITVDAGADPVAFRFIVQPTDAISVSSTVIWEE